VTIGPNNRAKRGSSSRAALGPVIRCEIGHTFSSGLFYWNNAIVFAAFATDALQRACLSAHRQTWQWVTNLAEQRRAGAVGEMRTHRLQIDVGVFRKQRVT